jgi:hypothetical protein
VGSGKEERRPAVGARPAAIDGAVLSREEMVEGETEGEGRGWGGSAISGGVEGRGRRAGGWR